MKYNESESESAQYLRMVVPMMARYKLSATPVNYAVCFEYVAETNQKLIRDVDSLINGSEVGSNEDFAAVYERYLAPVGIEEATRVNNYLLELLGELQESVLETNRETSKYSQSLGDSSRKLQSDHGTQVSLRIINDLLSDTRSMQKVSSDMREKLEKSQHEVDILRDQLQRARKESAIDPLTGLTNRAGLATEMLSMLEDTEVAKDSRCLLMVDIDHFKRVNDTYGHMVGDKVIQFVAKSLKNLVKGKDTVARYGGEEFAIILPNTSLSGAQSLAENIRVAIEKTRIKRSGSGESIGQVTVSIGVAQYHTGESSEELFERADTALYQSKNSGRNKVTVAELENNVGV